MSLDPRRLLTFRAVAAERSFSRAARSLSLTQPAVSQQIRALEVEAGGRLIERGAGGFELTALGTVLLPHADALADVLTLAETQLAETRAARRARLRVGAFPSALAELVPASLTELRASVDDFEAGVVEGGTDDLVASVRDGTLHVAVCFEDGGREPVAAPGLRRVDLFAETMSAALPPSHRLAGRRRIRLAELADEVWTAATPGGIIERACAAAGFTPQVAYRTSDPLAIRALVTAGLTVTLAPQLLGPAELPGVAFVELAPPQPTRRVFAVVPRGAAHPLVDEFLALLREHARRL
jgi:DNA-binding transcriptional LysR family regulator